ncbi:MAG: hypothetical protein OXG05_10645 [Gammaproteobacteria bacterium]|nr:hypothetical protein [Gammaproteobacteria bacterium]
MCAVVSYDETLVDTIKITVPVTGGDLQDGQVIQARYRLKDSDDCATGTWGVWSDIGEATYRDDDGTTTPSDNRFEVGDTITNMPTGFFGASLRGATMQQSGGVVTITINDEGYVETQDYRWTCDASVGCRVVDRVVELGTIVETER